MKTTKRVARGTSKVKGKKLGRGIARVTKPVKKSVRKVAAKKPRRIAKKGALGRTTAQPTA
jgi:hypothetical protein